MENKEFEEQLKSRMMAFSIGVMRMVEALPKGRVADVVGKQLMRSATSVGANYRAACRGRPKADFVAKLSIAEEEADESQYWLEILASLNQIDREIFGSLHTEACELTAILTSSIKTAKQKM
jgi:four helix bundle protein